jgi:probable phosphoglycerate mutase
MSEVCGEEDAPPLWLVRHAESTWNASGRWQGQADPPLSERGRGQAERLAEALRDEGIELLVASDLARAAETAVIVGARLGLVPQPEPRLRELDAGAWSGLTRARIAARDGEALARFDAGDPSAPAGGAESRVDVARRARAALAERLAATPGARLAIVSHEGVLGSLLPGLRLANATWRRAARSELRIAADLGA